MNYLKDIDCIPNLLKFINCDYKLTQIINYLQKATGLEENDLDKEIQLVFGKQKISIFENNNIIYKILDKKAYKKFKAINILSIDILKLQQVILPYKEEYVGEYLVIVSQIKLIPINNQIEKKYLDINKNLNISNFYVLDNKINYYYKDLLKSSDYNNLIDLLNLLGARDLIDFNNFGFDQNSKTIKIIDLDAFKRIEFNEFNLFLKNRYLKLDKVIDQYPEILNLLT